MKEKLRAIGTAVFKDYADFAKWMETEEGKLWGHYHWSDTLYKEALKKGLLKNEKCICFYKLQTEIPGLSKALELYGKNRTLCLDYLSKTTQYLKAYGQRFYVFITSKAFTIIYVAKQKYVVPTRFLDVELYAAYDGLTVTQMKALAGENLPGLVPAENKSDSADSVRGKISEKKQEIAFAEQEIKAQKEQMEQEIEEMKAQIEAKYAEQFALLAKKKQELSEMKEKLETQLAVLDTQIYAIRCYLGETINFTKITEGREAPLSVPVVAYQKIRYLDEEMGKWLAVYDFDGEDCKYFEDILKARPDLVELFCPSEKCISLARISRSNTQYGIHPEVANALKKYEAYHGKQMAVFLRSGENLWIGWTDEERIALSSDNVFYEPKKPEIVDDQQDAELLHNSTKKDVISRYFIFYLLQGIFDNGSFLAVPEKVSLSVPSPYLVFSYADGWIEDNHYGVWNEIVERTNSQRMQKGDMVMTLVRITRDDIHAQSLNLSPLRYQSWNNDRGRGDRNRTHDASIPHMEILPINLIETTETFEITSRKYKCIDKNEGVEGMYFADLQRTDEFIGIEKTSWDITDRRAARRDLKGLTDEELLEVWKKLYDEHNFYSTDEKHYWRESVAIAKIKEEQECYLSAKKDSCIVTKKTARANMLVYPDEFLNLTYLNSVWVRYIILSRKIGIWRIPGVGSIDYAGALPYLNKILVYLKKREESEAELLSPYMELYPDWQVDLSEWKMEKEYHRLTEHRAKLFAKHVEKQNEKTMR